MPFWRDEFAKKAVQIDIEPDADTPFDAGMSVRLLEGVALVPSFRVTPARLHRTRSLLVDGNDAVAIIVNLDERIVASQCGRELELGAGEATAILHADPAEIRCAQMRSLSVLVPYKIATESVRDVGAAAMRRIESSNEALRLLIGYVGMLEKGFRIDSRELAHSIAEHICDLCALVIGATRDATQRAAERGLRAGRLQAIKTDILKNLASCRLSITGVATRAGVTPRYVQMLFEAEGTTFSQYVLDRRLASAHGRLIDRRSLWRSIADVAYDAGFGDLSYFNRTFRRRYGCRPSTVRAEALRGR
jgi:AraC-like DNA-binding protein